MNQSKSEGFDGEKTQKLSPAIGLFGLAMEMRNQKLTQEVVDGLIPELPFLEAFVGQYVQNPESNPVVRQLFLYALGRLHSDIATEGEVCIAQRRSMN